MADDRYNRWQGLAIAQLSVAVALISGLSIAGLGVGLSLLQDREFIQTHPCTVAFMCSLCLLLLAAFGCCGAVITRLLDFRLTARKVRKDQDPEYPLPLSMFGSDSEAFGRATWRLFWTGCISFLFGSLLLIVSIALVYA